MNFRDIKKIAREYKAIDSIDGTIPYKIRREIFSLLSFILIVILFGYLFFSFGETGRILGIALIVFSIWILWFSIEAYYNSVSMRDPHSTGITPIVSRIVLHTKKKDITKSFLRSKTGKEIIRRLSIPKEEIGNYIKGNRQRIIDIHIDSHFIDLPLYVSTLTNTDTSFRDFLFKNTIQEKDLANLSEWIERRYYSAVVKRRWWSKERLMRVKSLGVSLSYGKAYFFKEFSLSVEDSSSDILFDYFSKELDSVERIFTRAKEANALVVGSSENFRMVNLLQKRIHRGNVHPAIEHKSLFVLDTETLLSDEASFEKNFIRILNEITKAGNIILVIKDLPGLIVRSNKIDINIMPVLDSYLSSSDLQVLAFSEKSLFHRHLESNSVIGTRFEKILVEDKDEDMIRVVVENYISSIEDGGKVFFDYNAIEEITKGIIRYFSQGSPIDEISDILVDLISKTSGSVSKEDVLNFFEERTGIPMSYVSRSEADKLLNLENILHKRVIGQDSAIGAISSALRRVRSEISNPDRPMGTFLFLGPTGVGKTETAKALSDSFFGGENIIKRLDMSEYSSDDSLDRLIGSFSDEKPGILSNMLRESPYGVLLLDEFEKTSPKVLDLFLQILDEGIFSDMRGEKVNARNLIIIATSNAGSDLVWKGEKDIVDKIIDRGIFKPELINRFDGVILFNPLKREEIMQIANLMMNKISRRVQEKGVKVSLSKEAMNYIVDEGTSTQFGARELNRVLQDKVESAVARMMLEGKLVKGSSIVIDQKDLD